MLNTSQIPKKYICRSTSFEKIATLHTATSLKELQNCIPRIIHVWSLFCSVRVYKSLHFQPILLEN